MNALALDLGTTWGWAILRDGKVVASGTEQLPSSALPMGERWVAFDAWLAETMNINRVDAVLYEVPFGKFVNVLKVQFGQATIVELQCESLGHDYMGIRPAEIKTFATGKGNAKKVDMLRAYLNRYEEFGLPAPPPDISEHEVDAVWLALYAATELSGLPLGHEGIEVVE